MTTPVKIPARRSAQVIQFPVSADQVERLVTGLETFNRNFESFNKNGAYIADKVGQVANDFTKVKSFAIKWLPWLVTAGAVFIPRLQDFLNHLPPFPK